MWCEISLDFVQTFCIFSRTKIDQIFFLRFHLVISVFQNNGLFSVRIDLSLDLQKKCAKVQILCMC